MGVLTSLEPDAASYIDLSWQRHLPAHATTGTISHTFNSTIILAELEWSKSEKGQLLHYCSLPNSLSKQRVKAIGCFGFET